MLREDVRSTFFRHPGSSASAPQAKAKSTRVCTFGVS